MQDTQATKARSQHIARAAIEAAIEAALDSIAENGDGGQYYEIEIRISEAETGVAEEANSGISG